VIAQEQPDNPLGKQNEEQLRREIACYEEKIAEIGWPATPAQWGMVSNYRTLISLRYKLLADIRVDGAEARAASPAEDEHPRPGSGHPDRQAG